jgi:hypothetical protein
MKTTFLTVVLAALTFPMIAVAGPDPELPDDDSLLTNWSSSLTGGVDIGWKGTWILKSATLNAPNGTLQFPSAGHTLVIDYFGNYRFDYSTAHFLGAIQMNTNTFSGSMAMVPPAGVMPAGIPDSCANTGRFFGDVSGQMFAPFDIDLDRLNPDGTPVYGLPWMEIKLDPAASTKPYVKCKGADIDVKSTGTILPPGAGRSAITDRGQVVLYDYEMNTDLTTLVIRGRGMPRITYVFNKAN